MKYHLISLAILMSWLLNAQPVKTAQITGERHEVPVGKHWIQNWFSAWDLMANEVLKLKKKEAPIFIFFDRKKIYTTSPYYTEAGGSFEGPAYNGQRLPWKEFEHAGMIHLPEGDTLPLQLATFAAPLEGKPDAYFLMAAPEFWAEEGVTDSLVGSDKLLTGIFLHEFSHTHQIEGIGRWLSRFEKRYPLDQSLNDDIIQNYFSGDSTYVRLFRDEVSNMYAAALETNPREVRRLGQKGMELLEARHRKYLLARDKGLPKLDAIFLTFEGMGQFMMFKYLAHAEGANASPEDALSSAVRGGYWWSQHEGLALFMLYEKLVPSPDWNIFFSTKPIDIISLLKKELR